MADYTSSYRAGPPRGGKFTAGDTLTDCNSAKWICTASGFPGTWVPNTQAIVNAAGVATQIATASTYFGGAETTEPAAPAANGYKLFAEDSTGKTALKVRFASGASQQIAVEP